MSRKILFDRFRNWLSMVDVEGLPADLSTTVDRTECYILRHRPASDAEALMVMEVLTENIRAGARSDGLDLVAARNLQGWLSRDMPGADAGPHRYGALALVK